MNIETVPPTIKTDTPYTGKRINLRRDWVDCGEDGVILREVVEHPGAVIVLPVHQNNTITLVRQFRHPLGLILYECPAGTKEINEIPLTTAKRELAEEAKLSAAEWVALGKLHPVPGLSNEVQDMFIARDLSPCEVNSDPGEFLEVHNFSLVEIKEMIKTGLITDSKTISTIFKAELNGYIGG